MQPTISYEKVRSFSDQQNLKGIIIGLAGTVGEQIFDTYHYQSYSDKMLTDKNEIFTFLSSRIGAHEGPSSDFEQAKELAKDIALNQKTSQENLDEKIKEIIADCYIKTYELISQNKDKVEKLANTAMKKGTLHEDEIYDTVNIPRPLHDFEHGAMTEKEMANLGQYRFIEAAKDESRDKNGNLIEID